MHIISTPRLQNSKCQVSVYLHWAGLRRLLKNQTLQHNNNGFIISEVLYGLQLFLEYVKIIRIWDNVTLVQPVSCCLCSKFKTKNNHLFHTLSNIYHKKCFLYPVWSVPLNTVAWSSCFSFCSNLPNFRCDQLRYNSNLPHFAYANSAAEFKPRHTRSHIQHPSWNKDNSSLANEEVE